MPQNRPTVDAEKQPSNLFSANEELIELGSFPFLTAGEGYLSCWMWQLRTGLIRGGSFALMTSAQAIW
jgi:hypothetical protein